jgi:hypothetical protein
MASTATECLPGPPVSPGLPGPHCCCGSADCVFLAHNGRLLDGLERDVTKAAQLGQALLVRHEAYVADSERDRRQMLASIDTLEQDKLALEASNAESIKANRALLDQLEQLNDAVSSSDAHIRALNDTLRSTEDELHRLSALAARTQILESQLLDLEREQIVLQSKLDTRTIDERTAVQRWRTAERTLGELQDQIDRIEREAREEHDRHLEVVARMERRMAVEGELNTAAARLKAKAGHDKATTSVVSHFVKDILLDNANLQHGILELREMLVNSNEEVERLRDQLSIHQPVSPSPNDSSSRLTLQKELEAEIDSPLNQQLHIHHHYHGPAPKPTKALSKAHIPTQRRPKKKRFSLTSGHFDPVPSMKRSSTATILSQTAVTVPNSHRWSTATTLAPGSLPGSPVSDSHRGSMYDRVFSDVAYDSSRPTSPPDSVDLRSPMFEPTKSHEYFDPEAYRHQRNRSQHLKSPMFPIIKSTPIPMMAKSSPALAVVSTVSPANSYTDTFVFSPDFSPHAQPQDAIPEENEDSTNSTPDAASLVSPAADDADDNLQEDIENAIQDALRSPVQLQKRPAFRRHASHESLISISGMDIHTLQSRPSQLLIPSSRYSTPRGAGSVGPELTPWTATAHGQLSNDMPDSTLSRSRLYSTIANHKRASRKTDTPSTSTLGKSIGGWVFGKWGATPAPTVTATATATPRPTSSHSHQTLSSQETGADSATPTPSVTSASETAKSAPETAKPVPETKKKVPIKLRPSGVNQSGPIWGFFDIPETPTNIEVSEYDAEALGEALAE